MDDSIYQDDYTDGSDSANLYGSDGEDFEEELEEFTFPDDDSNSNIDF